MLIIILSFSQALGFSFPLVVIKPAREARGPEARGLRALGLLLADGAPTVGGGRLFDGSTRFFFTETAVTPERKVEKSFPRSEINRHGEG